MRRETWRTIAVCRAAAVALTAAQRAGRPPTYRELGAMIGVSPEAAWRAVRRLEEAGYVERAGRGKDRAVRVLVPWVDAGGGGER